MSPKPSSIGNQPPTGLHALLARELATARDEIKALKPQIAAKEAAANQQVAAKEAAVKQALDQERSRAEGLARELASAREEIEALKPQATAEQALDQAPGRAEVRGPTLALPSRAETAGPSKSEPTPEVARNTQPPSVRASEFPSPQASPTAHSPDEGRLLARAEAFIKRSDISAARLLLTRALESGSTRAAYVLGQTYDPRWISEWQARGVSADVTKARELYARAYAGGINEAREQIEATK